jgi:hypothetical protein
MGLMPSLIVSRERVAEYGEVFTPPHIVEAMLDLVKNETLRIESRFLEPACGTGNFLVEVLRRKLGEVDRRYKSSQREWERNAIVAVMSLYGIDIQEDNVRECRRRLLDIFREQYVRRYKAKGDLRCQEAARAVLAVNIVCGDALAMKTQHGQPIVFAEWSPVNGNLIKRRDFAFEDLTDRGAQADAHLRTQQASLFGDHDRSLFDEEASPKSENGQTVFIPRPVRDHPLMPYLELAHADR